MALSRPVCPPGVSPSGTGKVFNAALMPGCPADSGVVEGGPDLWPYVQAALDAAGAYARANARPGMRVAVYFPARTEGWRCDSPPVSGDSGVAILGDPGFTRFYFRCTVGFMIGFRQNQSPGTTLDVSYRPDSATALGPGAGAGQYHGVRTKLDAIATFPSGSLCHAASTGWGAYSTLTFGGVFSGPVSTTLPACGRLCGFGDVYQFGGPFLFESLAGGTIRMWFRDASQVDAPMAVAPHWLVTMTPGAAITGPVAFDLTIDFAGGACWGFLNETQATVTCQLIGYTSAPVSPAVGASGLVGKRLARQDIHAFEVGPNANSGRLDIECHGWYVATGAPYPNLGAGLAMTQTGQGTQTLANRANRFINVGYVPNRIGMLLLNDTLGVTSGAGNRRMAAYGTVAGTSNSEGYVTQSGQGLNFCASNQIRDITMWMVNGGVGVALGSLLYSEIRDLVQQSATVGVATYGLGAIYTLLVRDSVISGSVHKFNMRISTVKIDACNWAENACRIGYVMHDCQFEISGKTEPTPAGADSVVYALALGNSIQGIIADMAIDSEVGAGFGKAVFHLVNPGQGINSSYHFRDIVVGPATGAVPIFLLDDNDVRPPTPTATTGVSQSKDADVQIERVFCQGTTYSTFCVATGGHWHVHIRQLSGTTYSTQHNFWPLTVPGDVGHFQVEAIP